MAECICTSCDHHTVCRQRAEEDNGMCRFCSPQALEERRWAQMLAGDGQTVAEYNARL